MVFASCIVNLSYLELNVSNLLHIPCRPNSLKQSS